MAKKLLLIDRDGTLIKEAPPTYQLDSFLKLEFYPHVFEYMRKIASEFNYELVMITNQDGLGTPSFPEESFWPVHNLIMKTLETEGIHFSEVLIDRSFPADGLWTRKPGTGMLTNYLNKDAYDIAGSFVIGDRVTDMELARNCGCKGIWLKLDESLGSAELKNTLEELRKDTIVLETADWQEVYEFLKSNV
jgi:imidazoleglycerol-phosphate dehydratase/histidinol-phosphatase